jgi:REP element-mobilizing transposase RayT
MEKRREIDFLMTQAVSEDSSTFMPKLEQWLDSGYGECLLRNPALAQIVAEYLRHFDGQRYDLLAWVVMPNHVHVLVKSLEGFAIDKVLHTWKSFTAHEINKLLGRSGQLWQTESYDHIVRDPQSVWSIANYIVTNPAKAGYQTSFVASRVPNT